MIRFSPDGRLLASVDGEQTVRVWDLARPDERLTVPIKAGPGTDIAFTPDSAAMAIIDGVEMSLFSLPALDQSTIFLGLPSPGRLWIDPRGERVCVLRSLPGGASSLVVHELRGGRRLNEFLPGCAVWDVCWEPQGERLAVACSDSVVRVWDWRDGAVAVTLKGHSALVTSVAYSPDGKTVASLSWDDTVRLWDADSGDELVHGDTGGNALQFSDDGRRLAYNGFHTVDRRKLVWDVAPAAMRILRGGKWEVTFSPDGRLLSGGGNRGLSVWDGRGGRFLLTVPCGTTAGSVFGADGTSLVATRQPPLRYPLSYDDAAGTVRVGMPSGVPPGPSRQIVLWPGDRPDYVDPSKLEDLPGAKPESVIAAPSTSRDGIWFAAIVGLKPPGPGAQLAWGDNTALAVWDRRSMRLVHSFPAPHREEQWFSPDSKWLVARSERGVRIWRVGSWEEYAQTIDATGGGRVCFTADGSVVAIPVSPTQVRLLEPGTWKELAVLESPQRHHPSGSAFNADGTRLAISSTDEVIQFWDLDALRESLAGLGLSWNGPGSTRKAFAQASPPLVRARIGDGDGSRPHDVIPPRDPAATERQVDLSDFYNLSLTESMHPLPNDTPRNDLGELPRGLVKFGETLFDVRGVVHLGSRSVGLEHFPPKALDIRLRQKCAKLHFLHGASWQDVEGAVIGSYRVRYADGATATLPILYARDVWDWWQVDRDAADPRSRVAWRGGNAASRASNRGLILFEMTWKNPRPDVEVTAVDFESAMRTGSAPFLIALTTEP